MSYILKRGEFLEMFFLEQRSKALCNKYVRRDVSSSVIEMIDIRDCLVEAYCAPKDPTLSDTSL